MNITEQLVEALRDLRADYVILLQAFNEALQGIDKSAEAMAEDTSSLKARDILSTYDSQFDNEPATYYTPLAGMHTHTWVHNVKAEFGDTRRICQQCLVMEKPKQDPVITVGVDFIAEGAHVVVMQSDGRVSKIIYSERHDAPDDDDVVSPTSTPEQRTAEQMASGSNAPTWMVLHCPGWPGGIDFPTKEAALRHLLHHRVTNETSLSYWVHQAGRVNWSPQETRDMVAQYIKEHDR